MKLSTWMPNLLTRSVATNELKQAQLPEKKAYSTPSASIDKFERSATASSSKEQTKVRSGGFIVDVQQLASSSKGIDLLKRTEQQVVETATRLGAELARLEKNNLVDYKNPVMLGMLMHEMDRRQTMGVFSLSFNRAAQEALIEAAGKPELLTQNLQPFLAQIQNQHRMSWDTNGAILQHNYFSSAVSNGLGLILDEGYHEILPDFPRPLGYAIELPVPTPIQQENGARRVKYQANLKHTFNAEVVPNAEQLKRSTRIYQEAQQRLDDTLHNMAVGKLSKEFVKPYKRVFPHSENH